MDEMIEHFCGGKAWIAIRPDCSGVSGIAGVGLLHFSAPSEDDASILGSPFMPDCPNLAYPNSLRSQANVEHEWIHYRATEKLLACPSPNHRVLCADVTDNSTILEWRNFEEQLVTSIQFFINRGLIADTISPWLATPERMALFTELIEEARDLRKRLIPFLTSCRVFAGAAKRYC